MLTSRSVWRLAATLHLAALCGCVTAPEPLPSAAARIDRVGLVRQLQPSPLVAEFSFRSSDPSAWDLVLAKGSGTPLLTLQRRGDQSFITGPLAGPGWGGPSAAAPRKAAGWHWLGERLARAEATAGERLVDPDSGSEFILLAQ